jgi:hypothetical protein
MPATNWVSVTVDAAFFVTAWESPVVQSLLRAKGIELSSAPHADAFVGIYPFLHKLVLPAGVIDLLTTFAQIAPDYGIPLIQINGYSYHVDRSC